MVGYVSFDRSALSHRYWVISAQNHFGLLIAISGTPQPKSLVFYFGPRAGLHSLAIILTLALVSKPK